MNTILVIEDDIIWQVKLQLMIEEHNYAVLVTTSLEEAKQLISQNKIDLIFADIRLPDGSSIDYFKENTPDCPIIFITEIADKAFVNQTLSIPYSTFFVKPFHSLTLYAAIQASLSNFNTNTHSAKALSVPIRYRQKTDIPLNTIYWICVEGNYSTIQTSSNRYVQKLSFSKIIPHLDERFIQIHKSIIVNKDVITSLNLVKNTVGIQDKIFSIGRSFRRNFIEKYYKTN